jgi:hypothetical protein
VSGVSSYPAATVPGVDPDHQAMADLHARDRWDAVALGLLAFTGWALIQVEALAMRILTRHL